MENLDLLITKFKEIKEELVKAGPLHNTVEGFMGGLKAHPKGSPERHQFISSHLEHGPFKDAMAVHPQGKQMHDMLHASRVAHLKSQYAGKGDAGVKAQIGHLDSKANAGLKVGAIKTTVGGDTGFHKSVDDELDDFLSKAYVSPFYTHGPSKPIAKPAAAPAAAPLRQRSEIMAEDKKRAVPKLTGLDRIKAEGTRPITAIDSKLTPFQIAANKKTPAGTPPSAAATGAAKKLTGLDRIRAESMKPITATTVKKDEDVDKAEGDVCSKCNMNKVSDSISKMCDPCRIARAQDKMKARGTPVEKPAVHPPRKLEKALGSRSMSGKMLGGGASQLTSPSDPGRANMLHDAMHGAYQPAAPAAPVAPKKLTGLDRIKAMSSEPLKRSEKDLLKQKTADKKFSNESFGKTINGRYPPAANSSSGMAMSCGEKMTLNKGGQWNLDKSDKPFKWPPFKEPIKKDPHPTTIRQLPPKNTDAKKDPYPTTIRQLDKALPVGQMNKNNEQWNLEKYVSPYYTHGPSKPVAKPAPKPATPVAKEEDEDKTNASPAQLNAHGQAVASAGGHVVPGQVLYGTEHRVTRDQSGNVIDQRSKSLPNVPHHQETVVPPQKQSDYSPLTSPPKLKAGAAGLHAGYSASATPNGSTPTPATKLGSPTQTHVPAGPKRVEMPAIKDETGMPKGTVAKAECSKCHADPCECQTTGVLVDKMDGDVGTGV